MNFAAKFEQFYANTEKVKSVFVITLWAEETLYVALNISGVEKATRKNWQLQVLWCSFAETNLKKKKWFWNWEKNILFNVVLSEL